MLAYTRVVAELGSIFEDQKPTGNRGRDLHADVEVPAWALSSADGVDVEVPEVLEHKGQPVRRACMHGPQVTVRLNPSLPDGAALRMRGEGEALAEGNNGDLYLHLKINRAATRAPQSPDGPAAATGNLPMVATMVGLSLLAAVAYALS